VVGEPRPPERGDVVWITLDPQVGHAQAGHRSALVLSPVAYNRQAELALFCPITSRTKGYPFEVAIPAGLPVAGVVLADQVRSMDWRGRRASAFCRLPDSVVEAVLRRLSRLLA
jgi:mRNA interferase MazF